MGLGKNIVLAAAVCATLSPSAAFATPQPARAHTTPAPQSAAATPALTSARPPHLPTMPLHASPPARSGRAEERTDQGGGTAASPGIPAAEHTVSRAESDEADDYWTPQRMAEALPVGADQSLQLARASHFRGVGSVGALFFRDGSGDHFCTASVVHSRRANLLITAGHCLYGADGYRSRLVFVPRYSNGARPFGTWRIRTMVVDRRWVRHFDQDLDFGFATVRPSHGREIEQVVRGNQLATDQGFHDWVYVIGYPKANADPADTAIYCRNWTTKAGRFQVRFDCQGYASGTSGSPWITHFNWRTGTGDVIGVIGGFHRGGWTSSVSYTSYFDHDIRHLYQTAVNLP